MAYGYGPAGTNNGNVVTQTITRGAASGGQTFLQTYTYTDGLNRLTSATEGATSGNTGWSRTFGYDPWGNGWVAGNSGVTLSSFTPGGPSNFWNAQQIVTNQLTIQGSTYDGAGNQKAIGGYTMTYDAENRMITNTINGGMAQYGYDGDGRRVTKTLAGQTTTYVYDAMGQLVAEYNGQSTDTGTKYVTICRWGSCGPKCRRSTS